MASPTAKKTSARQNQPGQASAATIEHHIYWGTRSRARTLAYCRRID
jgi:hypothetical protein